MKNLAYMADDDSYLDDEEIHYARKFKTPKKNRINNREQIRKAQKEKQKMREQSVKIALEDLQILNNPEEEEEDYYYLDEDIENMF